MPQLDIKKITIIIIYTDIITDIVSPMSLLTFYIMENQKWNRF